jgi:2-haloacid dehalogenase
MGLRAAEILFVAFAGWDVAGAGWFGYQTFWNNRLNAVAEELNVRADATGTTLTELVSFLSAR